MNNYSVNYVQLAGDSLVNGQENLATAAFRELARNPAPLQSSTSTTIVITGVQRVCHVLPGGRHHRELVMI